MVSNLDLLCCPLCKGRLEEGEARLGCGACRREFPVVGEVLDLRVHAPAADPVEAGAPGHRALGPAASTSDVRSAQRMWSCVRAARGEIPRQGTFVDLAPGTGGQLMVQRDSFRTLAAMDAAPARLAELGHRLAEAGVTGTLLVAANVDALPLATQSVDLIRLDPWRPVPAAPREILSEVHRVLRAGGIGYVSAPAALPSLAHGSRRPRLPSLGGLDLAAREAFADGYRFVAPGVTRIPGWGRWSAAYRRVQAVAGFEYTLGRGAHAPTRGSFPWLLEHLATRHELVCWRVRPDVADGKRMPSHETMIFGRFHFPESASST